MQVQSPPSHRRDAWIAAGVLLLLGALWLVFQLYWQGAVLVVLAAGLGGVNWRHGRQIAVQGADVPSSRREPAPSREGSPRKKGQRKRR